MRSAQRWADDPCCKGDPQAPHFHTPINVGVFHVRWIPQSETVGICGIKCCMMHTFCLHGIIRLESKITLVFFSAFEILIIFHIFIYY